MKNGICPLVARAEYLAVKILCPAGLVSMQRDFAQWLEVVLMLFGYSFGAAWTGGLAVYDSCAERLCVLAEELYMGFVGLSCTLTLYYVNLLCFSRMGYL
jgi:hypothetical protein